MTADTRAVELSSDAARTGLIVDHLDHLVQSDPQQVIVVARQMLADSQSDDGLSMELWSAIGRALYELGDMVRAPDAMRRAFRFGERALAQDSDRLISVRVSAAAIFADAGELREAMSQLDQVEANSTREVVGRVHLQRSFILCQAGRLNDASMSANVAESSLRRAVDRLGLLRLLLVRSLIELQRDDLAGAEWILNRARKLALSMDQRVVAAGAVANLGVVHSRSGRIVEALEKFDEALVAYVAAGSPLRVMTVLETDRAEALLRAGLFRDAVAAAHAAANRAVASGNVVTRGDCELLLARTELAAGMHVQARDTAAKAASTLRAGHRGAMALQARATGLQAALELTRSDPGASSLFGRSRRLGNRLQQLGWPSTADDLRCARIRTASRMNLLSMVEDDLDALSRSTRSRRPEVALRAWFAESLARLHRQDLPGAHRAVKAGMDALDRFRSSANDLQMRAGLSAVGEDLSALAVHLAVESGAPSQVLKWAERTRAHAYANADGPISERAIPSVAAIARKLDGRVLVEFVVDGPTVSAVVVDRGRARLVDLGELAKIESVVERLTAWLDRAALPDASGSVNVATTTASRLSALLIEPLALPDGRPVVIIPDGPLHSVPWSALSAVRRTPVSVHLSARLWLSASGRPQELQRGAIDLIVGPDVAGSARERAAVRQFYDSALVTTGRRATSPALVRALGRPGVLQVAAHGVFRPDRPLRSTLRLADQHVSIFELNSLDIRRTLVILSSCEAGVHSVSAGGEVVGLSAILISRGASTVIAPIHTVPDEVCAEFVADFHRAFDEGVTAAAALAAVRAEWLERPSAAHWMTAAAFTCFGTGAAVLIQSP